MVEDSPSTFSLALQQLWLLLAFFQSSERSWSISRFGAVGLNDTQAASSTPAGLATIGNRVSSMALLQQPMSAKLALRLAPFVASPLLLAFLVKLYRHRSHWRSLSLPAPPHSFFWGHLRLFGEHASKFFGKHIDYTAESFANAYSDGLLFLDLWPFAPTICLVSDPQIADQIVRVDNLPKCLKAMGVHFPIFGKESLALAASDEKGEEHWRTVRKSIAPGFKKGHLERSWTVDVVEEGDDFVARLTQRAKDGKPALMAEYLVDTTLDLILRVTIGSQDKQLSRNILKVLNRQLDHASSMGINSIIGKYNPVARYGEWSRTRQMHNLLAPSCIEHIEASRAGAIESKEKRDVLDWALAMHPDFSVTTLVDQIKTFILAGHDTASSTLAWTYYHLSRQPDVLAKLRKEHDAVLGADTIGREGDIINKDPTILNGLNYTLAIIREALRLYPPAAAIREADSDLYVVEHNGQKYSVAGCMLWINHYCLHRSKATWGDDVKEFKPERWLDAQGNMAPTPLAWQPFSKGPKNCIGMEFGLLEQKILLAMTVRKFDFEYAGEGVPYQIFRLTAQPHNAIPMRLKLTGKKEQ